MFFIWHSKVVKKKSSLDACRKCQFLFLILFFLKSLMKTTFLCNVKVLKTVQVKAWAAFHGSVFLWKMLLPCGCNKGWKILLTIWFSDFSASLLYTSWIYTHNSSFLAKALVLIFLAKSINRDKEGKDVLRSLSEGVCCCFCRYLGEMKFKAISSSQAAVLFCRYWLLNLVPSPVPARRGTLALSWTRADGVGKVWAGERDLPLLSSTD